MKTIKAAIVASVLWATPTFAQDIKDAEGICTIYGKLATTIMELRQNGVDMGSAMGITDDKTTQSLVIAVYDSPRFSTEAHKQRAIRDFANEVMLMCYKELR